MNRPMASALFGVLLCGTAACSTSDTSDATGGSDAPGHGGEAPTGGAGAPGGGPSNQGGQAASAGGAGGLGEAGTGGTHAGGTSQGGQGQASGGTGGSSGITAASCLAPIFVGDDIPVLNYDQFSPTMGSHCFGTNHQKIEGIDKVLFLGDSVTVGTPPTNLNPGNVYRAILAEKLADLLDLEPPGFGWGAANPNSGVALPHESGDFISCAKWGAHTNDLLTHDMQIQECIPEDKRNLRYLVIMTMGGNDLQGMAEETHPRKPSRSSGKLPRSLSASCAKPWSG